MGKIKDRIEKEVQFIEKNVAERDVTDVLIGLRFNDNNVHWHVPENDDRTKEIIRQGMSLYNISETATSIAQSGFSGKERIKMTLHMPLGDRMVFSAALRDFKQAFPDTRVNLSIQGGDQLWKYNPNVDLTLQEYDLEIKPGCQEATNKSNSRDYHYVHSFRESIEQQLDVKIPMGAIKPDIWISEEEYHAAPLVAGPYWLITAGINPSWTYKTYPFERWQDVVNSNKDITFVQIGIGGKIGYNIKEAGKEVKKTYEAPILQGDNVVNYIGKSDGKNFRQLFNLFLHCEGSMGLVSSQMHIAAGFDKPCVTVAGAREPVWFTRYFGHQYVTTEGCLPCSIDKACWKCNENCKYLVKLSDGSEIPKCVDLIQPSHITDRLNYYYDGGRLERGKKSKVNFKNINKNLEIKEKIVYIKPDNLIDKLSVEAHRAGGMEQGRLECRNDGMKEYGKDGIMENGKDGIMECGKDGIKRKDGIKECGNDGIVEQWGRNELQGIELNFLASFSSAGGGEQSAKKMIQVLRDAGCKVNAYSWAEIHRDHQDIGLLGDRNKFVEKIHTQLGTGEFSLHGNDEKQLPLLVIGNDQVYEMPKDAAFRKIVESSSQVFLVINWAVGDVPKTEWLVKKLTAVVFHNSEKIQDWNKKYKPVEKIHEFSLQNNRPKLIPFIGAIDIEKFLALPIAKREKDQPLVIVKHGVADNRKYVCKDTIDKGEKIHLWQSHCIRRLDVDFYSWLVNGKLKKYNPRFEFMQAPEELRNHFKDHPQFKFYRWNEISVTDFLARGHIYLDRCSDEWRHNFPRTCAEALSAGLPVIAEQRDGWKDRIIHGDTGFLSIHDNDFEDKLELLARKEDYRLAMGNAAREYAKEKLDPRRWVGLVKELIN